MGLNLFNVEKLKIISYEEQERNPGGIPFEVMFNPDSISVSHVNQYSKKRGSPPRYQYSRSKKLSLNLVFDGTGVTDFGITKLLGMGTKSVTEQINRFLSLCFHLVGKIHEPKYLKIEWGEGVLKSFDCRLESVDIEYSLFDRHGAPLHAVLKTNFIEDCDPKKKVLQEGKSSPDLSHTRIVKSGDTLPLLSKEIYGSSQYYLRIAQANNIDDFRNLTPGQEIIFPPLAKRA